jgi:aminopeptidase N
MFDEYAYPRGAAVLHILRTSLGEDKWWKGINHYLVKFAHQPVETEDFRKAMEEATGERLGWFFDEWLYKMGHPVFQVTKNFNPATSTLEITVRQEQKPDPAWQYPQETFFRVPVEIELVVNAKPRIEKVMIEAQAEQTFSFKVEAPPEIVDFDYGNTLIKQLTFLKPIAELIHQLRNDPDSMGRMWALGQLSATLRSSTGTPEDRSAIVNAISVAVRNDRFWGMRAEAAGALSGINDEYVQGALAAAAFDADPHVRLRAIASLSSTHHPASVPVYEKALMDRSYGVIRQASLTLGRSKAPAAYDELVELLGQPSWRNQVRASALAGLTELGDARAVEAGLRYIVPGNEPSVRVAAARLLGSLGKDDPRVIPLLTQLLISGAEDSNVELIVAAGSALPKGDPRTAQAFDDAKVKAAGNQNVRDILDRLATQRAGGKL